MAERVDLNAVAERTRQASEGPWKPSKASDAVIAPKADRVDPWRDTEGYYGGPVVGESMLPADREFIIHARSDVPALVAELKIAREVVEAARRVAHSPDVIGDSDPAARRLFDLGEAVRAYDQHADPSTHDRSGGS